VPAPDGDIVYIAGRRCPSVALPRQQVAVMRCLLGIRQYFVYLLLFRIHRDIFDDAKVQYHHPLCQ
jgi:hypothetical protein